MKSILVTSLLMLALLGLGIGCTEEPSPSTEPQRVTLFSRGDYDSYEKSTFSFEHATRDDPDRSITRNDWEIEFGNGGDVFHVTMVTDDRSRLLDLGLMQWENMDLAALPSLPANPVPTRDPKLPAIVGHMYLVHTADRETDLYALFRVEVLEPDDCCTISWKQIDPPAPAAPRCLDPSTP